MFKLSIIYQARLSVYSLILCIIGDTYCIAVLVDDLETGEWEPISHRKSASASFVVKLRNQSREQDIPLSTQRNDGPVNSLLVRLLLNLCAECNSAHDSVTKLLVQHRLVRISVVLHNLVESVDKWLDGWHRSSTTSVRAACVELGKLGLGDVENGGELRDICFVGLRLSVEDGGNCDFGSTEGAGD